MNFIEENKIAGGTELLNPIAIFKEHFPLVAGETTADLGCGPMGYFIIQAAKLIGDRGKAYAVDVLKDALSGTEGRARAEGLNNLQIVWSNLEIYGATKIPDESLDSALIVNTLFQSAKQTEIIQEARRLLKPNGKLLIIDWKKINSPLGPAITSRLDPEKVKELAMAVGFNLIEEFDAGTMHFGLIFSK